MKYTLLVLAFLKAMSALAAILFAGCGTFSYTPHGQKQPVDPANVPPPPTYVQPPDIAPRLEGLAAGQQETNGRLGEIGETLKGIEGLLEKRSTTNTGNANTAGNETESGSLSGQSPQDSTTVFVYSPDGCSVCKQMERDVQGSVLAFKFYHDESKFPRWVTRNAGAIGYPVLHWFDGRSWRTQSGWSGLLPFLALYDRTRMRATAPAIPAQQSYLLYRGGNSWTWPGDLRQHLLQHGYTADQVARMSDADCIRAHDLAHTSGVRIQINSTAPRPGIFRRFSNWLFGWSSSGTQYAYAVAAGPSKRSQIKAVKSKARSDIRAIKKGTAGAAGVDVYAAPVRVYRTRGCPTC